MNKERGISARPFVSCCCYVERGPKLLVISRLFSFLSIVFQFSKLNNKTKQKIGLFISSLILFPRTGVLARSAPAACRESRRTTSSAKPAAKYFTWTASPAWCVTSSCPRGRNSTLSTRTSLCAKKTTWAPVPLRKSAWTQVSGLLLGRHDALF